MTETRRPILLERVANLAIILVAALIVAQFAQRWVSARETPATTPVAKSRVTSTVVGDIIPASGEIEFASAPYTFVLYQKSTCGFCTKGMPQYKQLFDAIQAEGGQFIAVTPESLEKNIEYLTSHGIKSVRVVPLEKSPLKARATPTLWRVDREGRVSHMWRGFNPSESHAKEWFKLLGQRKD